MHGVKNSEKTVIIALLIIIPLLTASIALSINSQFHEGMKVLPYGYLSNDDIAFFNACSFGQIFITGRLRDSINVSALRAVAEVNELPELSGEVLATLLRNYMTGRVIIAGFAKDLLTDMVSDQSLFDILSSSVAEGKNLMMIAFSDGNDELHDFYGAWLKLLEYSGARPHVFLVNPNSDSNDKDPYRAVPLDPRMFKAAAIAVSVMNTEWGVATGVFIIENTTNPVKDIALASCIFVNTPDVVKDGDVDGNSITRMEGFQFLGYIGWKHSITLGDQWVKTEYYYATATSGENTYRFYLAYNIHSQKPWVILGGNSVDFTTITDWNTDTYPGQVLWDWGPKNLVCGGTISFEVSGFSGISASISYSGFLGVVYCSSDFTDPGAGIANTYNKNIGVNLPFITYTVEPASIGMLDPTKPFGVEPMVVNHDFIANYGGVIYYKAYLYDPGHEPPVVEG